MFVTFWGVRGSIPAPGAQTSRWGGNTSCIEVRQEGLTPLVLDMGTGARPLGNKLARDGERELDVVFTHLHMDHLFGFPFFAPVYSNCTIRITVPALSDLEAEEKVARYLDGTYHPMRLRDLPADVTFHAIRPGRPFERNGWRLTGCQLNHPGGAVGYRIEAGGESLCFITDTAPFARPGQGVAAGEAPASGEKRILKLLQGADMVIYDTMYPFDEYIEKMDFGHSYPEYAAALCRHAGVRELVLFHHLPDASDDTLDALEAHWAEQPGPLTVSMAREGDTVAVAEVVRRNVVNAEG